MTAFSDLLRRAQACGIKRIRWDLDVDKGLVHESNAGVSGPGAWEGWAWCENASRMTQSTDASGEAVLRSLVKQMEDKNAARQR